jgi:hypothetical protein
MSELDHKRKARRKHTAEYFTPPALVNEMLDKLPPEVWFSEKTFIDPAGGNGNFLVEVLVRKLQTGSAPLQALSTIYSVELMPDNVEEMKQRLLNIISPLAPKDIVEAKRILDHNIVCADALSWNFEEWKAPSTLKAKTLF